jgi:hypothetical protein
MSFFSGFLLGTNVEKQASSEKIESQKFKLRLFKENLDRVRIDVNRTFIDTFGRSKVAIYDYRSPNVED